MTTTTKLQVTATCKPPMMGHTVKLPLKGVSNVDAVYMHKDAYGNFVVRVSSGDMYSVTPTGEYGIWKGHELRVA